MYFDALTMAAMADELRAHILGGRVQKVLLPDDLSVGMEVYAQGERRYLLASAHPEHAPPAPGRGEDAAGGGETHAAATSVAQIRARGADRDYRAATL